MQHEASTNTNNHILIDWVIEELIQLTLIVNVSYYLLIYETASVLNCWTLDLGIGFCLWKNNIFNTKYFVDTFFYLLNMSKIKLKWNHLFCNLTQTLIVDFRTSISPTIRYRLFVKIQKTFIEKYKPQTGTTFCEINFLKNKLFRDFFIQSRKKIEHLINKRQLLGKIKSIIFFGLEN